MAKNFESDITRFIKQYKQEKPATEALQRAGRDLLWDVNLDAEQQEGFRSAKVAQAPYVYYQDA